VSRCEASQGKDRKVSVDWVFEDGARLELRANLGSEPVLIEHESASPPFYSSTPETATEFEQGSLPAWSVIWCLYEEK
jgi:hypothetical protein